MNEKLIRDFCNGETPEFHYMVEVAQRLENELGSNLSLDDAVSLYGEIAYNSFVCSDGFIINEYLHKDLYRTLGNRGASVVVSSLYKNGEAGENWFYWNFGNYMDQHKLKSILPKLITSGKIKENK